MIVLYVSVNSSTNPKMKKNVNLALKAQAKNGQKDISRLLVGTGITQFA